jgi:predicted chitinase
MFNYTKNVARSFAYTLPAILKNKIPSIHGLFDQLTNKEKIGTSKETLSEARTILKEDVFGLLKKGLDNATKEVKTGKLYQTEEEEFEAFDKAFSTDDDKESFDNSFLGDDYSSISSGDDNESFSFDDNESSSQPVIGSSEAAIIGQVAGQAAGRSAGQAAGQAVASGIHSIANNLGNNPNDRITAESAFSTARFSRLGIGTNIAIGNILKSSILANASFLEGIHKFQTEHEQDFYLKQLEHNFAISTMTSEIITKLDELKNANVVTATATDLITQRMSGSESTTNYSKIFRSDTGFDINEYLSYMVKRFKSSFKDNSQILEIFADAPIAQGFKMLLDGIIPERFGKQLEQFDSYIQNLGLVLNDRAKNLAKSLGEKEDSFNISKIAGKALDFFTVDQDSTAKGPDLSNIIKGQAVAFDGFAHRTLVEIIPSYLADIHAELKAMRLGSGFEKPDDRKLYDFKSGRFTSEKLVRQQTENRIERNSSQHFGSIRNLIDHEDDDPELSKILTDSNSSVRFGGDVSFDDQINKIVKKLEDQNKHEEAAKILAGKDKLNNQLTAGKRVNDTLRILRDHNFSFDYDKTNGDKFEDQLNDIEEKLRKAGQTEKADTIASTKEKLVSSLKKHGKRFASVTTAGLRNSASVINEENRSVAGEEGVQRMLHSGQMYDNERGRVIPITEVPGEQVGDGTTGRPTPLREKMAIPDIDEGISMSGSKGFDDGSAKNPSIIRNEDGNVTVGSLLKAPMNLVSKAMYMFETKVSDVLFGSPDKEDSGGFFNKFKDFFLGDRDPSGGGRTGALGKFFESIRDNIFNPLKLSIFGDGTGGDTDTSVIGTAKRWLKESFESSKGFLFGSLTLTGNGNLERQGGLFGGLINYFSGASGKLRDFLMGSGEGDDAKIGLLTGIKNKFNSLVGNVKDYFFGSDDGRDGIFSGAIRGGKTFFSNLWDSFQKIAIKPFAEVLFGKVDENGKRIGGVFGSAVNATKDFSSRLWTSFQDKAINPFNDYLFGKKGSDGVRKDGLFNTTIEKGKNLTSRLWTSLQDTALKPFSNYLFGKLDLADGLRKNGLIRNLWSSFENKAITPFKNYLMGPDGLVERGKTLVGKISTELSSQIFQPLKRIFFGKEEVVDKNGNIITKSIGIFPKLLDEFKRSILAPLNRIFFSKNGAIDKITASLKEAFTPIKEAFIGQDGIFPKIKQGLADTFQDLKVSLFGKEKKDSKPYLEIIGAKISKGIEQVGTWLQDTLKPVTNWIKEGGEWLRFKVFKPFDKWLNDPKTGIITRLNGQLSGFFFGKLNKDTNEKEGGLFNSIHKKIDFFFYGDKDTPGFVKRVIEPAKKFVLDEIWKPLKTNVLEMWDGTKTFFKDEIFKPLQGTLQPFIVEAKEQWRLLKEWTKGPLWDALKGVGQDIKKTLDDTFTNLFGTTLGEMLKKNVLDPIKDALGGVRKFLGGTLSALLKFPVNIIKGASDELKASHIKRGMGGYLSEDERNRIISEKKLDPTKLPAGSGSSITDSTPKTDDKKTKDGTKKEGVKPSISDTTPETETRAERRVRVANERKERQSGLKNPKKSRDITTPTLDTTTPKVDLTRPERPPKVDITSSTPKADKDEKEITPSRGSSVKSKDRQDPIRLAQATADNTHNIYQFLTKHLWGVGKNVERIVQHFKIKDTKLGGNTGDKKAGLMGKLKDLVTNPVGFVTNLVGDTADFVKKKVTGLLDKVGKIITAPFRLLANALKGFNKFIGSMREMFGETIGAFKDLLISGIGGALTLLGTGIREGAKLFGTVLTELTKVAGTLLGSISEVAIGILKAGAGLLTSVVEIAGSLTTTLVKVGGEMLTTAVKVTKDIVTGLAKITFDAIGSAFNMITGRGKGKVASLTPVYVVGGYLAGTEGGAKSLKTAKLNFGGPNASRLKRAVIGGAAGSLTGVGAIIGAAAGFFSPEITQSLLKGKADLLNAYTRSKKLISEPFEKLSEKLKKPNIQKIKDQITESLGKFKEVFETVKKDFIKKFQDLDLTKVKDEIVKKFQNLDITKVKDTIIKKANDLKAHKDNLVSKVKDFNLNKTIEKVKLGVTAQVDKTKLDYRDLKRNVQSRLLDPLAEKFYKDGQFSLDEAVEYTRLNRIKITKKIINFKNDFLKRVSGIKENIQKRLLTPLAEKFYKDGQFSLDQAVEYTRLNRIKIPKKIINFKNDFLKRVKSIKENIIDKRLLTPLAEKHFKDGKLTLEQAIEYTKYDKLRIGSVEYSRLNLIKIGKEIINFKNDFLKRVRGIKENIQKRLLTPLAEKHFKDGNLTLDEAFEYSKLARTVSVITKIRDFKKDFFNRVRNFKKKIQKRLLSPIAEDKFRRGELTLEEAIEYSKYDKLRIQTLNKSTLAHRLTRATAGAVVGSSIGPVGSLALGAAGFMSPEIKGGFESVRNKADQAKKYAIENKWKDKLLTTGHKTVDHLSKIRTGFKAFSQALWMILPVIGSGIAALVNFFIGGVFVKLLGGLLGGAKAVGKGLLAGGAAAGRGLWAGTKMLGRGIAAGGKILGVGGGLAVGGALAAGYAGNKIRDYADKNIENKAAKRIVKTTGSVAKYAGIGAAIGSIIPIPGVSTALGAGVGAGIGVIVENWDLIVSGVKSFGSLIVSAGKGIIHTIFGKGAKFDKNGKVTQKESDGIIGKFKNLIFGSKGKKTEDGQITKDATRGLWGNIKNGFGNVLTVFGKKLNGEKVGFRDFTKNTVIDDVINGVANAFTYLKDKFTAIVDGVRDTFNAVKKAIIDGFNYFKSGQFIEDIKNIPKKVLDAVLAWWKKPGVMGDVGNKVSETASNVGNFFTASKEGGWGNRLKRWGGQISTGPEYTTVDKNNKEIIKPKDEVKKPEITKAPEVKPQEPIKLEITKVPEIKANIKTPEVKQELPKSDNVIPIKSKEIIKPEIIKSPEVKQELPKSDNFTPIRQKTQSVSERTLSEDEIKEKWALATKRKNDFLRKHRMLNEEKQKNKINPQDILINTTKSFSGLLKQTGTNLFQNFFGKDAKLDANGKVTQKETDGLLGRFKARLFGSNTKKTKDGQVYKEGNLGLLDSAQKMVSNTFGVLQKALLRKKWSWRDIIVGTPLEKTWDSVISFFDTFHKKVKEFGEWFGNIGKRVGKWFDTISEFFSSFHQKIKDFGNWITGIGPRITNWFSEIITNIKTSISDGFKYFTSGEFVADIKALPGRIVGAIVGAAKDIASNIWNGAKEKVSNIFNNGKDSITDTKNSIVDKAKSAVDRVTTREGWAKTFGNLQDATNIEVKSEINNVKPNIKSPEVKQELPKSDNFTPIRQKTQSVSERTLSEDEIKEKWALATKRKNDFLQKHHKNAQAEFKAGFENKDFAFNGSLDPNQITKDFHTRFTKDSQVAFEGGSNVANRAFGGPLDPNKLTMVGEIGPELLDPKGNVIAGGIGKKPLFENPFLGKLAEQREKFLNDGLKNTEYEPSGNRIFTDVLDERNDPSFKDVQTNQPVNKESILNKDEDLLSILRDIRTNTYFTAANTETINSLALAYTKEEFERLRTSMGALSGLRADKAFSPGDGLSYGKSGLTSTIFDLKELEEEGKNEDGTPKKSGGMFGWVKNLFGGGAKSEDSSKQPSNTANESSSSSTPDISSSPGGNTSSSSGSSTSSSSGSSTSSSSSDNTGSSSGISSSSTPSAINTDNNKTVTKVANLNKETIVKVLKAEGIKEPVQQAMFLAQADHETMGFKKLVESFKYKPARLAKIFSKYVKGTADAQALINAGPEAIGDRVYGGRMGNGGIKGNGYKYRGRGIFHLTGLSNYKAAGKDIGVDIVNNPDLVATDPSVAIKTAIWFWKKNRLARFGDNVKAATIVINGGENGLPEREAKYAKYIKEIGNINKSADAIQDEPVEPPQTSQADISANPGSETTSSSSDTTPDITKTPGAEPSIDTPDTSTGTETSTPDITKAPGAEAGTNPTSVAEASTVDIKPTQPDITKAPGAEATSGMSTSPGVLPEKASIPTATPTADLESMVKKADSGVNIDGLNPDFKKNFAIMLTEHYNTGGKKVQVNSGFRTREQQAALFKKYGSPRAARPGHSKHEKGNAIDINSVDGNALAQKGLLKKFNFSRPIPSEKWHIVNGGPGSGSTPNVAETGDSGGESKPDSIPELSPKETEKVANSPNPIKESSMSSVTEAANDPSYNQSSGQQGSGQSGQQRQLSSGQSGSNQQSQSQSGRKGIFGSLLSAGVSSMAGGKFDKNSFGKSLIQSFAPKLGNIDPRNLKSSLLGMIPSIGGLNINNLNKDTVKSAAMKFGLNKANSFSQKIDSSNPMINTLVPTGSVGLSNFKSMIPSFGNQGIDSSNPMTNTLVPTRSKSMIPSFGNQGIDSSNPMTNTLVPTSNPIAAPINNFMDSTVSSAASMPNLTQPSQDNNDALMRAISSAGSLGGNSQDVLNKMLEALNTIAKNTSSLDGLSSKLDNAGSPPAATNTTNNVTAVDATNRRQSKNLFSLNQPRLTNNDPGMSSAISKIIAG